MGIERSLVFVCVTALGCGGGTTARPTTATAPPADAATPASNGELFLDGAVGFQMQLPEGWERQQEEEQPSEGSEIEPSDIAPTMHALVSVTKYPASHESLNPAIQVVVRDRPANVDALSVVSGTLDLLGSGYREFAVVESPAERTIGGAQGAATRFRYTAPLADRASRVQVEGRLYVAVRGDDVFIVTMTGAQAGDDRCEEEFRAALESMRITPPQP